jgi:hypothetical protein
MITRENLQSLYLDWVNNYLTIDKFAEHHGLTTKEAELLLIVAKSCHENPHPEA